MIPILVSLRKPVITARYWMIGVPTIDVFIVFFVHRLIKNYHHEKWKNFRYNTFIFILSIAIIQILWKNFSGFEQAIYYTQQKSTWSGVESVKPFLKYCSTGSISVFGPPYYYAFVSHSNEDIFIEPDHSSKRSLSGNCPILAWGENVGRIGLNDKMMPFNDFVRDATDEQILAKFDINVDPETIKIVRHRTGFVVLKKFLGVSNDPLNIDWK